MESLIEEFSKIWKNLPPPSLEKSGENSPALRTNSEIFQGEPLLREFVENVCKRGKNDLKPLMKNKMCCEKYMSKLKQVPKNQVKTPISQTQPKTQTAFFYMMNQPNRPKLAFQAIKKVSNSIYFSKYHNGPYGH